MALDSCLDFFELAFILIPLVGPVAEKIGIDLIWFGVLLSINLQTSFLTPPFGFALFYLRSVTPKEVKTSDIYWGMLPFVLIQAFMVFLIIYFPSLISTDAAADMKEKIELRIERPGPTMDYGIPELNFSTDAYESGSEAPLPQFSTEPEENK